MTEYWLQKKTIGGWSNITWYEDKNQAEVNYDKVRQNAGYSYRLVEVTTLQEHRLQEETIIEPPSVDDYKKVKEKIWSTPEPKKDGWGDVNTKPDNHWGKGPSGELNETKHGMSGKVWMINHTNKTRVRVTPDEVQRMTEAGYERGGPKTPFRS